VVKFESLDPEIRGVLDKKVSELGLRVEGSPVEKYVHELYRELDRRGLKKFRPVCYLTDEWGCPDQQPVLGIPFYLADPKLRRLEHAVDKLEDERQIMMYMRHEAGHVFNYAYRLYTTPAWRRLFGPFFRAYRDDYRPVPFSKNYVRHIEGWYAQKHPDEDWAETFAVWMTPGSRWRDDYGSWPGALAKLERCAAIMEEVRDQEPSVDDDELDEDVSEIEYSVEDYYRDNAVSTPDLPPGIDGSLRAIFAELPRSEETHAASTLILSSARAIARSVFTWTGHFPEHTRLLLRHLAARADELALTYPRGHERDALVSLTSFVTSLGMSHVHRGTYTP
jgi:hypothetical protein